MVDPDPFGIHKDVLDDTPWYIPGADNRRGTERSLGFCNPFGHEDDDVRVMGGIYDPRNEEYRWQCRNYAQGRYLMTCANGHSDIIMRLCYGHVWMLQHHHSRAKNGFCPRCGFPPRVRELSEKADDLARRLSDPAAWPDDRRRWASALRDTQAELTELWQRGTYNTGAPLRLEEVS